MGNPQPREGYGKTKYLDPKGESAWSMIKRIVMQGRPKADLKDDQHTKQTRRTS